MDLSAVSRALTKLLGLRNSVIEDCAAVERAVARHAQGMDLADALHLSSSKEADAFVTFDRKLSIAAAEQPDIPTVKLLDAEGFD